MHSRREQPLASAHVRGEAALKYSPRLPMAFAQASFRTGSVHSVAVSLLGSSGALAVWEPKTLIAKTDPAAASTPATASVSLTSAAPEPDPTYSSLIQPKSDQVVWATPPSDAVSSLMQGNLKYATD